MNTRTIADLEVSCIGLGGMPMSLADRPPEQQSRQTIRAAVEAGMTFIDTADVYCIDDDDIGHNERLIAETLAEMGDAGRAVVVATKGGCKRPGGNWTVDGRPERLKEACEASLRALGTDCIELYQLHAPDDEVPFADSVGALADLAGQGKIRRVGLSNVDVAQIEEARAIVPIASVQNRCNLWDTGSFKNGIVDYCTRHSIAFLPHSPVGGHRGHARTQSDATLAELAGTYAASSYQILLAWLLAVSPVMVPIPGASKVASAQSSAAAAALQLDQPDIERLSAMAGATAYPS